MAVTGLCTKTMTNLTSASTRLRLPQDATTAIIVAMSAPAHLFADIYTSRFSEQVMIYGVEKDGGVTYLTMQRGIGGTTARSWPEDACVRITQQVAGKPCLDSGAEGGTTLGDILSGLVIGAGLELVVTDPNKPVLRMANTGVKSGNYGGATVSATGQLVSIPTAWPASAVPSFEIHCDDSGGPTPVGGEVSSVEGIGPDATGNVSLARNTGDNVPVSLSTPVFIAVQGAMTKTTVGRIVALATQQDPDLSGLVRRVDGLLPDSDGVVAFIKAPTSNQYTTQKIVLTSSNGMAVTDAKTFAQYAATFAQMPDVDLAYNKANGELSVTFGETTETQVTVPAAELTIADGVLSLSLGGKPAASAPIGVPDIDFVVGIDPATGILTVQIGDQQDSVQLTVLSAVNSVPSAPAGANQKLIKTPSGTYLFVPDT